MVYLFLKIVIAGILIKVIQLISVRAALPPAAKAYIHTYFPNEKISFVEKFEQTFRVSLSNGCKLEFSVKGEPIELVGTMLPQDVIPPLVFSYLEKNYGTVSVQKIKFVLCGYFLTLHNGIELEFDLDGNLKNNLNF